MILLLKRPTGAFYMAFPVRAINGSIGETMVLRNQENLWNHQQYCCYRQRVHGTGYHPAQRLPAVFSDEFHKNTVADGIFNDFAMLIFNQSKFLGEFTSHRNDHPPIG